MKKFYIFQFDQVFTRNPLIMINKAKPTEIESNLRNKKELKTLLMEIHKENPLIVFVKYENQSQIVTLSEIVGAHLDQLLGKKRTLLSEDEIYLINTNEITHFIKNVVLEFNKKNSNEIISEKEFDRIIWVDANEDRVKQAKSMGCTTIFFREENNDYLEKLSDTILSNDIEKQWQVYRAYKDSFWYRHKANIVCFVPLILGIIGLILSLALGEANIVPNIGNRIVQALLGFIFFSLPPTIILAPPYIYTTYYQVKPTISLEPTRRENDSLFKRLGHSLRVVTSSLNKQDTVPDEQTALIDKAHPLAGPIPSMTLQMLWKKKVIMPTQNKPINDDPVNLSPKV